MARAEVEVRDDEVVVTLRVEEDVRGFKGHPRASIWFVGAATLVGDALEDGTQSVSKLPPAHGSQKPGLHTLGWFCSLTQ